MKVLVLIPDKTKQFSNALYTALRVRVGTCDVYHLNDEQFEGIENFFRALIRLEQYDRIVVAMPPSYILKKIKFFRSLPAVAVLRLYRDHDAENQQMLKLFRKMPWIRWIGVDDEVCAAFVQRDWDAYWIPPSYDAEWFHHNRPERDMPFVHIFDPKRDLSEFLQKNLPVEWQMIPAADRDHYVSEHVKPQDIVLFHPENEHYEPNLVIQAMACGAVVMLPEQDVKRRVLYGWHDHHDCLFYKDISQIPSLLAKVLLQPTVRAGLSHHAVDKAMLFHPREVGQRLGGCLEIAVRTPQEYPAPRRLFGIELGW